MPATPESDFLHRQCSAGPPTDPRQLAQQIEIYFSVVQRKLLDPNDFTDLDDLQQRLLAFPHRYEQTATPFEWTFTRQDLAKLLQRLDEKDRLRPAA